MPGILRDENVVVDLSPRQSTWNVLVPSTARNFVGTKVDDATNAQLPRLCGAAKELRDCHNQKRQEKFHHT